jgi:hypothetical protein
VRRARGRGIASPSARNDGSARLCEARSAEAIQTFMHGAL